MITIRLNGIDFNVLLLNPDDKRFIYRGTARCGTTYFDTGSIHIDNTLPPAIMRQVVAHELTHAYIMAYGFHAHGKYDDEELCEFMAAYGASICSDADAVMKHYAKAEV